MGWLGLLVAGMILAPILPIDDPTTPDFEALSAAPGWSKHLLGTDQLGRDTLSRLLFGGRVSLLVGLAAVAIAMVVGGLVGMFAGFRHGVVERISLLIADSLVSFPNIVLIIVVIAIFKPSVQSLIAGLALMFLATFFRLARARTITVSNREYVVAARAVGARDRAILRREIFPSVYWGLVTYSALAMSTAIVAEGSLSFIGLGLPPPNPSWGSMIAGGMDRIESDPHISLTPIAVMFLTLMALNVVGEWLRDRFDGEERES